MSVTGPTPAAAREAAAKEVVGATEAATVWQLCWPQPWSTHCTHCGCQPGNRFSGGWNLAKQINERGCTLVLPPLAKLVNEMS